MFNILWLQTSFKVQAAGMVPYRVLSWIEHVWCKVQSDERGCISNDEPGMCCLPESSNDLVANNWGSLASYCVHWVLKSWRAKQASTPPTASPTRQARKYLQPQPTAVHHRLTPPTDHVIILPWLCWTCYQLHPPHSCHHPLTMIIAGLWTAVHCHSFPRKQWGETDWPEHTCMVSQLFTWGRAHMFTFCLDFTLFKNQMTWK